MLKSGVWGLGVGVWAALSGLAAAQPVERPVGRPVGGVTTGAGIGPAAGIVAGGGATAPGAGITGMVQRMSGQNALGRAAFPVPQRRGTGLAIEDMRSSPVRPRSFDDMMIQMERSGTQSIMLSNEGEPERVWTFGPQGMQAVELYQAGRRDAPVAEIKEKLDRLYETPGNWRQTDAAALAPRNNMNPGQGSLWNKWNDYWTLKKAENALKDGKYEEARPHLTIAASSSRKEVSSQAEILKAKHKAAATGEALARLVRSARSRDVFTREAAFEQAAFWSGKEAAPQLAAARQIWDAYSMPQLLPSGETRDAAEVLRELEAAANLHDRAAYQKSIDAARAGILSLPRSQRAAAARALLAIAGRWNEAAASSLSLSFIRADKTAAARDLENALWAGTEGARVQNMAKELAHWTR